MDGVDGIGDGGNDPFSCGGSVGAVGRGDDGDSSVTSLRHSDVEVLGGEGGGNVHGGSGIIGGVIDVFLSIDTRCVQYTLSRARYANDI